MRCSGLQDDKGACPRRQEFWDLEWWVVFSELKEKGGLQFATNPSAGKSETGDVHAPCRLQDPGEP